ncbi:MAG TPA: GIY-YIG nuclease family protein [Candidatus Dojkabacteria bacterium]|jgi:putative endonuclease
MNYVYILYSEKLKKYYVGRSSDLKKRMIMHNNGSVPFTSRGVPWELVYYAAFINKSDAVVEEKFLKTGKGRDRRKYLLKHFIESRES